MDHTTSESTRQNFYKARVLVIEDNPDDQLLLQRLTQHALPEVHPISFDSASQVLAYLDSCSTNELPKLVLLDLYFPRREDGLQLLEQLKGHPLRHQFPIVVVSRSESVDDIRQCYDAGANSFITKPSSEPEWLAYFDSLRHYWWETVTLPPNRPTTK